MQYLGAREARHPNEVSLVAVFDRAYSNRATGGSELAVSQGFERVNSVWGRGGT